MEFAEPGEDIEFEMTYKGFRTIVKYSKEDKVYYGKIEDIRDLVNYESENYEGLERAFHEAVDDYLTFCEF
jgi:predicted HicB family RNase H-like nuclease